MPNASVGNCRNHRGWVVTALSRVLDRLERVKQTGSGRWIALCPAHEDHSPSLSIRALEDGRVLVYDFAGCSVEDVLRALGLKLADLFEKQLAHSLPRTHSSIPARDLLEVLDHEVTVVALILADIVHDRGVSPNQFARLTQAAARIGKARDMANPATVNRHAA
jgi:hypothetical protein